MKVSPEANTSASSGGYTGSGGHYGHYTGASSYTGWGSGGKGGKGGWFGTPNLTYGRRSDGDARAPRRDDDLSQFTWTCSGCQKSNKIIDAECYNCKDKRPSSVKSGGHLLFTAIIVVDLDEHLGMKAEPSDKDGMLKVCVIENGGALMKWNMASMQEIVKVDDLIMCINGVSGPSKGMLDKLSGRNLELVILREPPLPPVPQCHFCQARPINPARRNSCCASCADSKGIVHDWNCDRQYGPNTVPGQDQYEYAMDKYTDRSMVLMTIFLFMAVVILNIIFSAVTLGSGGLAWTAAAAKPCYPLQAGFDPYNTGSAVISFKWDTNRTGLSLIETIPAGTYLNTSICVGSSQYNCLAIDANGELTIGYKKIWTLHVLDTVTSATIADARTSYLRVNIQLDSSQKLAANRDGSKVYLSSSSGTSTTWRVRLTQRCFLTCYHGVYTVESNYVTGAHVYLGSAQSGVPHMWSMSKSWYLSGVTSSQTETLCNCFRFHPVVQDTSVCYSRIYGWEWELDDVYTFANSKLGIENGQLFDTEFRCSAHPDYGTNGNLKCGIGLGIYWFGEYSSISSFMIFSLVISSLVLACGLYYVAAQGWRNLPGWPTLTGLLMRFPAPWAIGCHFFCCFIVFLLMVLLFVFVTMFFAKHTELAKFAEDDWSFTRPFYYAAYSPGTLANSQDGNKLKNTLLINAAGTSSSGSRRRRSR